MEGSTNGGRTAGREEPILVNQRTAEIHSADCSIYRRANKQMDGYKGRRKEEAMHPEDNPKKKERDGNGDKD